jgi:hexosaminidase
VRLFGAPLLAVLAAIGLAAPAAAQDDARPETIPALQSWKATGGAFELAQRPRVVVRHSDRRMLAPEARQLARDLEKLTGGPVDITTSGASRSRPGDVVLRRSKLGPSLGREGHVLRIGKRFKIGARRAAGAFYGGRTLLQLLRSGDAIPRGHARDWPRYPERGLMVDAGRKYYTPGWLAGELHEMAYLKLNTLHLHFSDNQGFRIESESHPEIVSEDHLTKAQVRRLLRLAERLHITVVPEIDMPGHLQAALSEHPQFQLQDAAGNREAAVLDVTNPKAVRFAKDLVKEYTRLFPGPYWHLGGDEVLPFVAYEVGRYPSLLEHARERYGPDANAKDAIHGFINEMNALVRSRGKTARMWADDIGGGSAVSRNPSIVAEWWTDVSPLSDPNPPGPRELLDLGHSVTNAGWFPTYVVNGVGGSPLKVRPNLTTAYEQWEPHRFYGILVGNEALQKPPEAVAPGEPDNLGSLVHLWNDNPTLTTEAEDISAIREPLRIVAQKTWGSPRLSEAYADFVPVMERIATGPGDTRPR